MATIRFIYKLKIHYYGFYFGNNPTIGEYETLQEAQQQKEKTIIDGGYAYIDSEKKILLSEEEVILHDARIAAKKTAFDYRKDSLCFGFYHHWDETKEVFFMLMNEQGELEIFFPDDHTKKRVVEARFLNLRGWKDLNRCFALSEGESLHVLGGDAHWAEKVPTLTTGYGSIPAVED